ncbi:substrate-binding domain-containing protein [Paracoccus indicus]|uniref:substrate-binding domain-containing protein n=1 Tax=Paracoccus indicus TaxID=2079229 RepID=UPI002342E887|nr:substrate-binding domain-containing protein [Paracoccus indicus]
MVHRSARSRKAISKDLGNTANLAAHRSDTESTLIDTAITNKSVAIMLHPTDANGSVGAVHKAVDADIPVFLVNAEINQKGLARAHLLSNIAQGTTLGEQALGLGNGQGWRHLRRTVRRAF